MIYILNRNAEVVFRKRKILAIPYYTWANRGASTMQVWLSTKIKNIRLNVPEK